MESKNKLIESKAFVDTVGIKGADLEDEILLLIFGAFCVTLSPMRSFLGDSYYVLPTNDCVGGYVLI